MACWHLALKEHPTLGESAEAADQRVKCHGVKSNVVLVYIIRETRSQPTFKIEQEPQEMNSKDDSSEVKEKRSFTALHTVVFFAHIIM